MSKLEIIRMGHPTLRQKAEPVDPKKITTSEIQNLIQQMKLAMREADGIGLAAPQINKSIQLALIEFELDPEKQDSDHEPPLHVFINPKIEYLAEPEQGYWEGCLSVPGLRGFVERPDRVKVDYLNEKGEEKSLTTWGFPAVVIQHELDHLEGILYVDKLKDPSMLVYNEEFEQFYEE